MIKYREIIQTVIKFSNNYLLAVSGGVDSMCLLSLFLDIKNKYDIKFEVAHFNHHMRDDSYLDAQLVEKFCNENNIKFHLGHGFNLRSEDAARKQRYAYLRSTLKAQELDYIVTGHQWQDQCETAIMGLVRGIPLDSLGMKMFGSDVFRPFLLTDKDDLIKHCIRKNIEWREDFTNSDNKYQRNKLRMAIPIIFDRNIYKAMKHNIAV